ncbi:MAG TPA: dienelactone hydrolase family protein [Acidimicrobiales bacterium]|nr:dienelactone hydrolase family protein [Acidimicrobiales bacterium]
MGDLPDLGVPYCFDPAAGDDPTGGLTIVALHGSPGDESSLLEAAHAIAPGAAVFSPRGPVDDGEGFGHLPRRPSPEEEAGLDPDLPTPWQEAVHRRTGELAELVGAACKAFGLDAGRVCVFGFSDGATTAAALALDHPAAVVGAVVLSGKPAFRPPGGRLLDRKQIFCATGRNDDVVTMDDYEELVEGLVTAGADVELHWYEVGHEIADEALVHAASWLARRLPPPPPADDDEQEDDA